MSFSRRVRCSLVGWPVGIVVGILMAAGGMAQEPEADPGVRSLTLAECRTLLLDRNLNVRAGSAGWLAAQATYQATRALFEPEFVGSAGRDKNSRQNTVEQAISQNSSYFEEENAAYGAALEELVPTGAKIRFGYTLRDLSNNLQSNRVDDVDNEYESFLGFSITQPLLRDAGVDVVMSRSRVAQAESEMAFQEFRREAMRMLAGLEAAYWDLYRYQRQTALRGESVQLAEKMVADNRERVQAGKMAELEVLQAEAGLALRRTRAAESRQYRVEAVNRLRTFFAEPVNDQAPAQTLRAADEPSLRTEPVNMGQRMTQAINLHPDYRMRYWETRREKVQVAYANNQRWPRLDLRASYGLNGLGDSAGTSWDQVTEMDYDAWAVAAELRIPLGGGFEERRMLEAARQRSRQALLQLQATEIEMHHAIDSAVRRVASAREQMENYQQVVVFNQRVLATEIERLEAGKSDSRKVLDAEEDLAEAQSSAVDSQVTYEKALIELELAGGSLLQARGLDADQLTTIVTAGAGE